MSRLLNLIEERKQKNERLLAEDKQNKILTEVVLANEEDRIINVIIDKILPLAIEGFPPSEQRRAWNNEGYYRVGCAEIAFEDKLSTVRTNVLTNKLRMKTGINSVSILAPAYHTKENIGLVCIDTYDLTSTCYIDDVEKWSWRWKY